MAIEELFLAKCKFESHRKRRRKIKMCNSVISFEVKFST
jgi:hypothetical protein